MNFGASKKSSAGFPASGRDHTRISQFLAREGLLPIDAKFPHDSFERGPSPAGITKAALQRGARQEDRNELAPLTHEEEHFALI